MCYKTSYNADDRSIRISQPALFQQGCTAFFFASHFGNRIILFQVRVCFRIVADNINAVENADNAVLPPHQCTIHAVGIPRVQQFFGVGGADGSDTVCCFNGTFHQIHHAVKFQQAGVIGGKSH